VGQKLRDTVLAAKVLGAVEASVFPPRVGWHCQDCPVRSRCWAWGWTAGPDESHHAQGVSIGGGAPDRRDVATRQPVARVGVPKIATSRHVSCSPAGPLTRGDRSDAGAGCLPCGRGRAILEPLALGAPAAARVRVPCPRLRPLWGPRRILGGDRAACVSGHPI